MKILSASIILALHVGIFVPSIASAATPKLDQPTAPATAIWQSTKAEHILGFPEVKPHNKGTLTFSSDSVTFSGKAGTSSIDRKDVTAVSSGNQKVEIWGMKGRVLRAVMPNGSGVAGAMFMHHRVDMLTVEYRDKQGAIHGAVFFLPAHQADQALQSFTQMLAPVQTEALTDPPVRVELATVPNCQDSVEPRSVLLAAPNWEHTDVPAAYRVLVYEHVIDRLRLTQGAGRVYRDGENDGHKLCPQYTIHISVAAFKTGSQVKRAILGPAGMFVGTTQMTFDTALNDASGSVDLHKQVKGTTRGESESTNVADSVAKSVAKQYASVLKETDKMAAAQAHTEAPSSERHFTSSPALGIRGSNLN
jgi:hypothetical protein